MGHHFKQQKKFPNKNIFIKSKMTTKNIWQMKGKIYTFDMQNKTIAYSNDIESDTVIIYIGGLGDTILSTPFTAELSEFCTNKVIKLIIPQLRSMPNYRTFRISDDVQDVNKIVQQEKGKKIILLGHSTGCQVAMLYIKEYDFKINQVILQAPVSDVQYEESINPNLAQQLQKARQTDYFVSPSDNMIWLSERFLSLNERHNLEDWFSCHLSDEYYLKWRQLKTPITSIVCGNDKYVVKSNVQKLKLGSEVFVIEGASHSMNQEASKEQFLKILSKIIL